MSNLDFIKEKLPKIHHNYNLAEKYLYSDPNSTIFKCGAICESFTNFALQKENIEVGFYDDNKTRIKKLSLNVIISDTTFKKLEYVREVRNLAVHKNNSSLEGANNVLKYTFDIACWFYKKYIDRNFVAKAYIAPENKNDEINETAKHLKDLEERVSALEKKKVEHTIQVTNVVQEKTIDNVALKDNGHKSIDEYELSVRSKNCLKSKNVDTIDKLVLLSDDDLLNLDNLGNKSFFEILNLIYSIKQNPELYDLEDKDEYYRYKNENQSFIKEYCESYDLKLELCGISQKAINVLNRNSYTKLSEIVLMKTTELKQLDGMGSKTFDELRSFLDKYYEDNKESILLHLSKSSTTKSAIKKQISNVFKYIGPFESVSRDSIISTFNQNDRFAVESTLLEMIDNKKLEFNGESYSLYKPSIFDILNSGDFKEREIDILTLRLQGLTLEEIGGKYNVSRERVRQIEAKVLKRIGDVVLKEDKYRYLYENYICEIEMFTEYLKEPATTYYYLHLRYNAGENEIEDCVRDSKVEIDDYPGLKEYLERNLVVINGDKVIANRFAVELFVLKNYFEEGIRFDDFAIKYNQILASNGLGDDERINCSSVSLRTRENRFAKSRSIINSYGKRIRYYPMDDNDFDELFEGIGLNTYSSGEYSCDKWYRDYPELMERYDIRSGDELHSVINKKYSGTNALLTVERMPYVRFGDFDFESFMLGELDIVSPIQKNHFANLISKKYGYNSSSLMGSPEYSDFVKKYSSGGMLFSKEVEDLLDEELAMLKNIFAEDFYTLDELRTLIKNNCQDMNPSILNRRNLSVLGFKASESYVYRNSSSASAYFKNEFTKDSITNIADLRRRFGYLGPFNNTLLQMKQSFDIVEYKPNVLIKTESLINIGITKNDLKQYINEIYEEIDDGEYFTIHSLRLEGHTDRIENLDLGDSFYSSLLGSSDKFKWVSLNGTCVLCKTTQNINRSTFLRTMIKKYEKPDLKVVRSDLLEHYGIDVKNEQITSVLNII